MRDIEGGICAPQGFKAEGVHCGIRKNKQKRDLALIVSDVRCTAAAVYTTNKVKGAPIAVTRSNIADGYAQAVICNSGNANTCNADGELKAQRMCELAAQYTGVDAKDGMPSLSEGLSYYGSGNAAEAIMTTDTVKKEFAVGFMTGGKHCRIGAIAKGSGMIHPNMATLLCFLTTDVAISADALHSALYDVIQDTLNMVSIDGDTSTNDMVSILANGEARNAVIEDTESDDYRAFKNALTYVMTKVSRAIAKDGEGATRLMECKVSGAKDKATAKTIAKSVVCSSLLKAAIFAADANWGRILCAIGYADAEFDITKIDVDLASSKGVIAVCRGGNGVEFSEEKAKEILLEDEVQILVRCNDGAAEAVAWGCDLTYDYVKINADYRT